MKPVRLGLIGAGRWGQVHLRTILSLGERCRLTHLGTGQPSRASLVPYPVRVEADWRRVVGSDCDAVIIATPALTHAQIVEACIEARKPCLVEKPFCMDIDTVERLHAQILKAEAAVLVGHTQLFSPAYQALRAQLRQTGQAVRAIMTERVGSERWRPELPVVWDWAPHDVSVCLDILGELPRHVEALAGPLGPAGLPGRISLRLDFSGACAWIQTGWLSAVKRRAVSVATDRQVYHVDELAGPKLTVAPLDGLVARQDIPVADNRSPMAAMLTYFLDGLAGGDRRYFGSALALQVTRVLADCEKCLTLRPLCEVSDTSERKV